jgi:cellulose synthase/poly-beta-1,6-N-acetylglucosamine synthase-like glycosyltransferase
MRRDGFTVETIYVDSGSTDKSVAVAVARGATVIELHSPRPTAAQGRNAGWRAASGNIVLFLDGDTILHPDFVADSLAAFDDPTVAIVWGHRRETLETRSVYNRVLDLDWIYPPGYSPFCGGDALFRRSTLELTGGFDDTLIAGEEPELCRRITGRDLRILHVDRPMTGHDLGITRFAQYWRRAMRAGNAFAEVSARFSQSDTPFWLAESRRNRISAIILIALPFFGVACSLVARSPWPFLCSVALLLALAVRTSWKARWKSSDHIALALYGVHSHLQQIPIFAGQLRFWMNRRRGNQAELVEYKQP